MTANIKKTAGHAGHADHTDHADHANHAGHSIIRLTVTKLLEFTVCSFTGWLYEVLLTLAVQGEFVNRGFSRLPLCPIYGIFGVFLPVLAAPFYGQKYAAVKIFLSTCAASTVFELAASYIIEAVLGYRLWDYSRWIFNFEGRISLLSSLVFGILGLFFLYVLRCWKQEARSKRQEKKPRYSEKNN